jgi:hypothetical protein
VKTVAKRRNWKTPYLQFLPLREHSPFPLEGPISVVREVTSVSHVNKKKHKNTLGGKNMELLILKIAVCTATVGLQ